MFPIPRVPPPHRPESTSSRLRRRHRQKVELRKLANEYVEALNTMYRGGCAGPRRHRRHGRMTEQLREAHAKTHAVALREAKRLAVERRGSCPTGAQALEELVGRPEAAPYGWRRVVPQIPLVALRIDEPSEDRTVNMLEALSAEEASYYAEESNVVKPEERSRQLFDELQQHYGFVGGSAEEYTRYFNRQDLPSNMWHFGVASEVQCVSGFSTVPKKDGHSQRKLIMLVACNYMWDDARGRHEHGLHGGAAIARAWVSGDVLELAAFDESNAFTYVEVPKWFWSWQAVPPLRAHSIWEKLPQELRDRVRWDEWIYPMYRRLAMGASHSVHILMDINVTTVGRAFQAARRLHSDKDEEQLDDEQWCARQRQRKDAAAAGGGYTVDGWVQAVRDAQRGGSRRRR